MSDELDRLFEANRARVTAAERDKEERIVAERAATERFNAMAVEILHPPLLRWVEYVRTQGWHAIEVSERRPSNIGGYDTRIGIRISNRPIESGKTNGVAGLTFSRSGVDGVNISESTILPGKGGVSGSGDYWPIEKVDEALIDLRMTALLKKLLT